MTILIYKRNGTIQVLEEFRTLSIDSRSVEADRLAFMRDGGLHREEFDPVSIIKIEVLL